MFRLRHSCLVLGLLTLPALGSEEAPKRDLPIATNALPPFTAISAKGFIHSTERGFKFPDGTVQTTAAGASGGVPNVNGITGAVTIAGGGDTSVSTAGSTISINSQTYSRIVIVKASGDATANGALLRAKLSETPASAAAPALLKLEPGIYDLGAAFFSLRTNIDIEGSGVERTTLLTSVGSQSDSFAGSGVLSGASSTEIRHLTIKNVASDSFGTSLWVEGANGFRITDVRLIAHGAENAGALRINNSNVLVSRLQTVTGDGSTTNPVGVAITGASNVTMQDSAVELVGGVAADGVHVNATAASSVRIDSTTVKVSATNQGYGVWVESGEVTLTNSFVSTRDMGSTLFRSAVVTAQSPNAKLLIHHSQLLADHGGTMYQTSAARGSGSTLKMYTSMLDSVTDGGPLCVLTYNENGALSICPTPIE